MFLQSLFQKALDSLACWPNVRRLLPSLSHEIDYCMQYIKLWVILRSLKSTSSKLLLGEEEAQSR